MEKDPYLKQRLCLRDPYLTTLNVFQAYTLKRIRDPNLDVTQKAQEYEAMILSNTAAAELVKLNTTSEFAPGLEDTLLMTMKGIAAGMQNTG